MRNHFRYFSILILLCTCGCSTVLEGTKQQITINSDPAGAKCEVINNGDVIATVEQTPGVITIPKSKNDIYVECSKDGYGKARKKNLADIAITSFGNMAMLQFSFIGNALDSASGAGHKYDSKVFVTLEKDTNTAQVSPPSPAQQMAAVPPAVIPPSGSPGSGQVVTLETQQLASQLVQEVQVAEVSAQAAQADSDDPPYIMLPAHTQELAGRLAQEVAQSNIAVNN